jgi:hypothetical protein
MKKVISFSLWGTNPKYTEGAIKNAYLAQHIYPGWETWFYVANDVPPNVISSINRLRGKIIYTGRVTPLAMLWRFTPMFDKTVDIVISRDTDSRLGYRERKMVEEFENSVYPVHSIRDHAYHNVPILGGMCGVKPKILPDYLDLDWFESFFKDKVDLNSTNVEYDFDQKFLREIILSCTLPDKLKCAVHDYRRNTFACASFDSRMDFYFHVPPRENNEYVGAPYSSTEELEIPFV